MTALEQRHKNYEDDFDNLVDAATDEIERSTPMDRQDLVMDYTRDASELTREYYADTRLLWQQYAGVTMPAYESATCDENEVLYRQVGGFSHTDWNGHNYTNLKKGHANGLEIADLWPDLKTIDDWQQFVAEMIGRSARLTTQNNRDLDPTHPRWARVPRGSNPCSFCVMLASRGFDYTSEDTANLGGSFHNGHCRCIAVCSWGKDKVFGYSLQKYKTMYDAAARAINDGTIAKRWGDQTRNVHLSPSNPKAVTFALRHMNPNDVRDGVTAQRTMPWTESKKLLSMRGQQKGTKQSWDDRQKRLGIQPSIEVLECHEIVFLERFAKLGETFKWIPKSDVGKSTNDFLWESHGTETELKTLSSTKYSAASRRISNAVTSAAEKHHVTKDVFILDYGETKLPDKLLYQLSMYNQRHESHIRELWVLDISGLHQIQLK